MAADYPSVTRIIAPFVDFSHVPADVLAIAAERGTIVHAACYAVVCGLMLPELDPEIAGRVRSFSTWFHRAVERVVLAETRLVDERLGFCGHPDLLVQIRGDAGLTLVDIKTPRVKTLTWRVQLAAYKRLVEVAGYQVGRVGSLRLHPDGGAAIFDEYLSSAKDLEIFISALNCHRFFKQAA